MQEGGDAMSKSSENTPPSVPAAAKQGGEVDARWAWTEPTVWTKRMLTALEEGVKGGVWSYPNEYFARNGYFSLEVAYRMACQSPCG
jgi:hypothetical protein